MASGDNRAAVTTIETASFVVCLDDGKPGDASERCNNFFLGDPSNRWSDKTLQFIVCENGISAFIGEHAMLDGMNARQINRHITHAIQRHTSSASDQTIALDHHDLVKELDFSLDLKLKDRIVRIRDQFQSKYSPIEFAHHESEVFGSAFLRRHRCPTKSGYQVVIQLACLLYYGYQPDSWETISMSHFHKGRVDWVQAAQSSMVAFCAAAGENAVPLAEQRTMFFDAVHEFANTMTQVLRGHGFKAHLHALLAMVQEGESLPSLFRDKSWLDTTVSSVKTVKTDCLEGAMLQETAFLMPEPKCIFVHYEIEDEG